MTDETQDGRQTAEVVADLTRRAEYATAPPPYDLDMDTSLVLRTSRDDEHIEVVNLEKYLNQPNRPRGGAQLTEPSDFAKYVNRLAGDATTVWIDQDSSCVTAVFNDHQDGVIAGWRDHTATLHLQRDPDWQHWSANDGHLMAQENFAELLEQLAHTVIRPDSATMLEVATTFQAHRNANFSRGTRLDSGDVQLTWQEETTAKAGASGKLDVPAEFTIAVAPFVGLTATEITARLRWRLREGSLGIGYQLHRPDLVRQQAFNDVRTMLANELDPPVFLGTAPSSSGVTQYAYGGPLKPRYGGAPVF